VFFLGLATTAPFFRDEPFFLVFGILFLLKAIIFIPIAVWEKKNLTVKTESQNHALIQQISDDAENYVAAGDITAAVNLLFRAANNPDNYLSFDEKKILREKAVALRDSNLENQ